MERKKKRQGEPSNGGNSDDSSESSDDIRNTFSDCVHITKAVDLNRVKKTIVKTPGLSTDCDQCKSTVAPVLDAPDAIDEFVDPEMDNSLWMCLKCGNQACGRYRNKHALDHYNTPHSDSHSVCLNTTKWSVWCYECDNEVNINGKKKLYECVEFIKRFAEGGGRKQQYTDINPNANNMDAVGLVIGTAPPVPILGLHYRSEYIARGLTNLGNTCFFNSVMQCLGQTPYLLKLLQETEAQGQKFKLPGGNLVMDDKSKKNIELEPLEGILEEWKPLTRVLASTLSELQCGRHDVYNPRPLFSALIQRMTQFGGGDQHDSHELLRHLLDAVREEDLRRYQRVILNKLGLNSKTDPSTVEGDKKKIIRFYGSQASELRLPTEQVFRGVLVSTLQCQECGHKSHREEYFLDLSLPISEKQRPPALRRKADELDESKPSKHQVKKERRHAKKNKQKLHIHGYTTSHGGHGSSSSNSFGGKDNNSSGIGDTPIEQHERDDNKSDSESDADVEDNIEDSANSQTPEDGTVKGAESGYNSDKHSPVAFPDMVVDDISEASPAVGMLSVSPLSPNSPASPASSETNIDLGSPLCGRNSPTEESNDQFERPESRLAFARIKSNDLKVDLEKLSIKNEANKEPDGAYGGVPPSDGIYNDDDIDADDDDQMMVDNDDMYSGTITTPSIAEGECSVLSCLNQFTASELMTANNKVGCEMCTKRHGGPDKKTVYTNATKQLLIYNPPAVLILHLKRFQVYHYRPSKILKYVKFPSLLDIAPFCSKRSRNLPSFTADQEQVLYSLYGVVEHSGSIHGGHYVAYIKVRSKIPDDNYRWQFLPKNQRESVNKKIEEANVSNGKWFYVSDSHAAEVPESRVLDANAYLLFYERLL